MLSLLYALLVGLLYEGKDYYAYHARLVASTAYIAYLYI